MTTTIKEVKCPDETKIFLRKPEVRDSILRNMPCHADEVRMCTDSRHAVGTAHAIALENEE